MARPHRFCRLSRRSFCLFTRHTALLATALSFFALSTHAATAPVGATPGSFTVSPSGAATYTIPIALPPGTNGMAPSLSLNYNSQGGNGLLGMGWSIGGLSVIHRCGSTIALDGIKGGVSYDANDKFCLDGERLIYDPALGHHRTQHESWQKIIAWVPSGSPAPSSFTVWSKDGTIREYGATNDSRIVAVGQSNVRLWALNKIEDRNGNYLTIGYNNNPTDYTPAFIRYTGNAAAGLASYNSVNFEYGPRTDFISWYEGGAIVQTTQRLTRITAYAGASLMRAYNLGYDDKGAVGRSRLTSVEECGSDGVCLPVTKFGWQDGSGVGFAPQANTSWLSGGGPLDRWFIAGDFVGDSATDFAVYQPSDGNIRVSRGNAAGGMDAPVSAYLGSGGSPSDHWFTAGDVNGDGKQDAVLFGPGTGRVKVALGTHTGNFSVAPGEGTYLGTGGSPSDRFFVVGDVNGDGRADAILYRPGVFSFSTTCQPGGCMMHTAVSPDSLSVALGRQTCASVDGCFDPPVTVTPNITLALSVTATTFPSNVRWVQSLITSDVNGDGRADLVIRYLESSTTPVSTFAGVALAKPTCATVGGCFDPMVSTPFGIKSNYINDRFTTADVNADGKADAIYYNPDTGYVSVALSTGIGSFTAQVDTYIATGGSLSNSWFTMADMNGDGKADVNLYQPTSGNVTIALATGSGGFAAPTSTYIGTGGSPSDRWFSIGDTDGNGKNDLVLYDPTSGVIGSSRENLPFPDLLTSISNGVGVNTVATHKPLIDSSVYTKDTSALYPYQDIQNATYVVSRLDQSNGIGGLNTTSYRYSGLKSHHQASTGLGFRQIQTTDPAGLVHVTNYNQTLNGAEGTVALSETWSGSVRVKQVSNTWTPTSYGDGRTLTQLTNTAEETRELNNSVAAIAYAAYAYDAYGNATSVITDSSDGYRKAASNTYQIDIANWYLGQLTQSQVTAEATGQTAQTRTSAFTYDGLNRLVTEVIEPNNATLKLTTTYGYNVFGHRTSATVSGPGIVTRATSQTYDPRGQFLTSKTNALGHTESYENTHATGALTKHTDVNGIITTWRYDGFGRKEIETRPDGNTTHTYGARPGGAGTLVHTYLSGLGVSTPRQNIVYHDILGRPVQTSTQGFGGNWIYQYTTYDNLGRTAKTSHPYFSGETPHQTTYTYDILGRATSATAPGNRVTSTAYNGLTVTVTNPKNQTLTTVKNSQGQVIRAVDNPSTSGTSYLYDPFGNLIQVTDVAGNITRMTYDLRGRKLSMHDPDMGNWSYSYNTLGELITQTDAKKQTTTMTYDLLGRMTTRVLPNGEGTATWTYGTVIPDIGKLKSTSNSNASETYVYDSLSRPTQVNTTISGSTHTLTTAYDALSRVDTLSYPGAGPKIKNIYDAYGFLTQVTNANTGTVYWKATAADAHSRLTSETLGNGLTTTHGYLHETGDLSYIRTGVNFGVQNLSYRFDEIGNLINRSDSNQGPIENFTYDNLNRLITVSGPSPKSYQYDTLGNITYKSDVGAYTYNPSNANSIRPHAVIGVSGALNTSFTYDPNGNQLTGNGRTIAYTSFNKPKTTIQGTKAVMYIYDANHRRLGKIIPGKITLYVNAYYEQTIVGTDVQHQYTIYAGTTSVAQLRSQALIPPPSITGVWPGSGPTGTSVFLFGDGFTSGTKVTIGTTPVTAVQLLGKGFLVFFVPSGNPTGTVNVTTPQGNASSTRNFGTPLAGLNLTGVWPGQGNTGQFIFLFGSGFSTGTKVSFNGTAAPMLHTLSPELLVAVVPKGATDGPIRVTNTQGTVSSSAFRGASPNSLKLYYLHTDHLGSIDTITDDTGQVIQRLSYDAFGKRRNPNGTDATIPITSQITKGYTRHEHDDEVNLIHMKAREYDPLLGRFITPDTIIPGALNSQSYNRYSYVNNNPLSYIDPSGHGFVKDLWDKGRDTLHNAGETLQRNIHRAGESLHLETVYRAQARALVASAYVAAGFFASGGNPAGAIAGARAFHESNKVYNAGGNTGDILTTGAISGIGTYATLEGMSGMYDSWINGIVQTQSVTLATAKVAGQQYVNAQFREAVGNYAARQGYSLAEFNLGLFGFSALGNGLAGSRLKSGNWDNTEWGIRGFGQRTNRLIGLPFDVVDTVLAYQGLPTASAVHYMFSSARGAPLTGHSLGALDVANLSGFGLAGASSRVYALPFGKVASGAGVTIGSGDAINGFGLGTLFNPDAAAVDTGFLGHACGLYSGCGQ